MNEKLLKSSEDIQMLYSWFLKSLQILNIVAGTREGTKIPNVYDFII